MKTFPSGSPQAEALALRRVLETIEAINECLPEASGVQDATEGLTNACTDLTMAQSVLDLQLKVAICWLSQGGALNCEQPDPCTCWTVNAPATSGSIDLWYPFLQCAVYPDVTLISGHLTTSASGQYDVRGGNMQFFTSLTFPLLVTVDGYVFIAFQEALLTFSAPLLTTVNGSFQVGSNANQLTHDFPLIETVTGDFVTSGTLATSLSVPLLTTVGGALMSIGGLALADVDISSLTNFDGDFEAVNAALTEESVNHILVVLDSQCVLSGAKNVLLDSGTSAAPTGLGAAAAANMIGRGVNVVTN